MKSLSDPLRPDKVEESSKQTTLIPSWVEELKKAMVQSVKQASVGAQPARIADSVAYQDGGVVSREVLRKNTWTVTVFAFDEGQGLSEHIAPFDALAHTLEGELETAISGVPLRLKEGEMVVMPAHEPHSLKAIARCKMLLTMIRS